MTLVKNENKPGHEACRCWWTTLIAPFSESECPILHKYAYNQIWNFYIFAPYQNSRMVNKDSAHRADVYIISIERLATEKLMFEVSEYS